MSSAETPNQKWGQVPQEPTIRMVENVDEFKVIMQNFEPANIDLIMPVISADQYAAFRAYCVSMKTFFAFPDMPQDAKDMFDFFGNFATYYKTALTAEGGYFSEIIARELESIKSSELKGVQGSEPKRGWGRFFQGNH